MGFYDLLDNKMSDNDHLKLDNIDLGVHFALRPHFLRYKVVENWNCKE